MQYIKENIVKNIFTVLCALLAVPFIAKSVQFIDYKKVEGIMGLFGLLLVYSGAVNFTFSYESINFNEKYS